MEVISIKAFYKDIFGECCPILDGFLEDQNNHDIGHFNVFNIADLAQTCNAKMPYNRRTYYKISLINGKNKVEYADKTVDIDEYGVLFATPKIPYNYTSLDNKQQGHFCIFTKNFLDKSKSGLIIDDLPIFKPNGNFVYHIDKEQYNEFEQIFFKINKEISSDYTYKYDLIRNYLIELIHYGQKLSPISTSENSINASSRISTLFIELLERQFPIESPAQGIQLKSAADFATTLGVHVNHLNKVLKETTTKTTTEIISSRIAQEAKILLKQTTWNISEIAYSLGFDEVAHFSNFFKKNTQLSPMSYRK
ncbi:MAG TPA: helix-turn-helix domain-containing protein [Saprospiraceae bacterium]|nr:helix-turn-helix domain-containing protein [Saprospiraceae bacterium]HMU03137.1 helix-turn-helix domain-containing protein [Saprospiraceae bacterium]